MKSRYKIAKNFLFFWTLFIGIGAVGGAVMMIADPSGKTMGMDAMLPYFQKLPFAEYVFRDFLFSGIALLIVNGITNLTASVLLFGNKKAGIYCGGIFGITLCFGYVYSFICFRLTLCRPSILFLDFCKL